MNKNGTLVYRLSLTGEKKGKKSICKQQVTEGDKGAKQSRHMQHTAAGKKKNAYVL